MATLMQNSQPASAQVPPDLEPDDEWKQALGMNIEAGLRSMIDRAKQKLDDELAKGITGPEERERLNADHSAMLKTIRQPAEEQSRITRERERGERRWAPGEQLDRAQSENMMKEQQAILDRIERERRNWVPVTSLQSGPPPAPRLPPLPLPPSGWFQPRHGAPPSESSVLTSLLHNRKMERVDRTSTQITARVPSRPPDLTRKKSIRRKPSMKARPIVEEFWKPSITPEEDAQMSRTFTLARRNNTASTKSSFKASSILTPAFHPPSSTSRPIVNERSLLLITSEEDAQMSQSVMLTRRSSTANATPSPKAPSVLSVAFTDPLEALSTDVNQERSSIYSADQEWTSSDPAREKDGEREEPGHEHTDDRSAHSSNHMLEDRIGFSHPPATSPSSVTYPRAGDISRVHVPLPSTSRPILNGRSLPSIAPEEDVQMSRLVMLARQSSTASAAPSPSILSVAFTDPLEALSADVDRERSSIYSVDHEWTSSDQAQGKDREREEPGHERTDGRSAHSSDHRFQDHIEFFSRPSSVPSSAAHPQPGDSSCVHVSEAQFKEGEAKWKELGAKRKEEELKRKEQEANSREMMARRKEEVKMMEEVRHKEFEVRRKEEGVKRKEQEVNSREMMVRQKEEEARRKEEELRKREDELGRREEDLNRREAEMRRREDDKLQEGFHELEEEIYRQRAEERKKQEVPSETFQPTPSPQVPNSSGPWPIPHRDERSTPAATSPPTDRVSMSASGRSNPTSGLSSASTQPTSTTITQPLSTPKPTGPVTPTPKSPTNSTPDAPLTEAELHWQQAEQAQQREEQSEHEQARLVLQEHERQTKAGKMMSREEVAKLFEAHRGQWDKIQTLGLLKWEDFPWPMFKRPKDPGDLTSLAITAYMLSSIHPQDRTTEERIKDDIRRWHPDRFVSQLLPKVKESEKERVSEGARSVARILNDLLRMHFQYTY